MLFPFSTFDILRAYEKGKFPTLDAQGNFILYRPESRALLPMSGVRISKTLSQSIRKNLYEISFDSSFSEVINSCVRTEENWITPELIWIYKALFASGWAHCVEAKREGKLVGGLYGLAIGGCFYIESMFTHESDASKICLVKLVDELQKQNFTLIDVQLMSPHLESMGGFETLDADFLRQLQPSLNKTTRWGRNLTNLQEALSRPIESENLIIRQFAHDNLKSLQQWISLPEVQRFTLVDPLQSDGDFQTYFDRAIARYSNGTPDPLAIFLKSNLENVIGTIGLFNPNAGIPMLEIAFDMNPAFWRRGLATEACEAMSNYAFKNFPIHRLQARCVPENRGSVRVLEKLGFKYEGILRKVMWHRGPWDIQYFSKLREEWDIEKKIFTSVTLPVKVTSQRA